MPLIDIRKTILNVETIRHEGGPRLSEPLRVGVAAAVIGNPYAGRYEENLLPLMEEMKPLGKQLAQELLDALGGDPKRIQAYGKASIVGVNGEIEHAALWHAPGGHGMRELLDAPAWVPSAKAMGTVGTRVMVPLACLRSLWVRSHYGIAELTIHDAPRPNELVLAVAMSTGGRVHARIGGLSLEQAERGEGPA